MSTPRGIFETFNNQSSVDSPPGVPSSPFAVAKESAPSPFAVAPQAAPKKESPFAIVTDDAPQADSKTIKLPERRKAEESPFQISEPQGFGFEAPQQAPPQARTENPFGHQQPAQAPAPSPFTMETPVAPAAPAAPSSAFGGWPQAEASPRPVAPTQEAYRPATIVAPAPEPKPQAVAPAPEAPAAPAPPAWPQAQQEAPAPAPTPAPEAASDSSNSDSYSIKQLELRAIFGVDREMTHEEIVQRARSLPGIRQIARVNETDISAVDALKKVISNLGFGSSPIKLYSGSVPIEFIREGKTLLAVQTDGGFAPGVRETLMLVARELSK